MSREGVETWTAVLALILSVLSLGWQIFDQVRSKREIVRLFPSGSSFAEAIVPVAGLYTAEADAVIFAFDIVNLGERSIYIRAVDPGSAFILDSTILTQLASGEARTISTVPIPLEAAFRRAQLGDKLVVKTTRGEYVIPLNFTDRANAMARSVKLTRETIQKNIEENFKVVE